jgi:hypothetical protein
VLPNAWKFLQHLATAFYWRNESGFNGRKVQNVVRYLQRPDAAAGATVRAMQVRFLLSIIAVVFLLVLAARASSAPRFRSAKFWPATTTIAAGLCPVAAKC